MQKIYTLLFLVLVVFSACNQVESINHSSLAGSDVEVIEITLTSIKIMGTPEMIETQLFTPTPDIRILPEEWQSWPIIPEVTNRAVEIYKRGQELGVDPNAFSKVGDCQNVKESFMRIYDVNQYELQNWQAEWQTTIDNFTGFFDRDAEAFGQGLNVAAALSPFHSNPDNCLPDESPVKCELRVANPSFAFIRFERWWEETLPDVYEEYLRNILDIIIAHGTVPILMTKADNVEGNHQINFIIAKLAYEYDIPMYNWWRAAQSLPYRGLDPEIKDGFHLDPQYAWTEQSVYALGTLDSIWKGTRGY